MVMNKFSIFLCTVAFCSGCAVTVMDKMMAGKNRVQSSGAHYRWKSNSTTQERQYVSEFLTVSACVANVSIEWEAKGSVLGYIHQYSSSKVWLMEPDCFLHSQE